MPSLLGFGMKQTSPKLYSPNSPFSANRPCKQGCGHQLSNMRGGFERSICNKSHIKCNTRWGSKKAEHLNCKQNVSVTEKMGMLSLLPFFCNMWQSWKSQCGEILSWRIFNLLFGTEAVNILLSLMAAECKSCISMKEIVSRMDIFLFSEK